MPIDETSTGWVTSDGLLYLTTDAAARAQAELDLKVENSTLIERGKEGLRRLRKRMEKTTPSQEPVPAAVGKVRMEIVDDLFARWITTNGDSFDNMEEAVLYQEALDVAERGGWATDPEAMRARLGLQRRLSGKVEPEAVELYTQSVESKRRVKLKPRGGG